MEARHRDGARGVVVGPATYRGEPVTFVRQSSSHPSRVVVRLLHRGRWITREVRWDALSGVGE